MSMNVRKGDRVRIIAGKDKGKVGEIIAINPTKQTVTVAGVNIVKRHRKDRSNTGQQTIKGGILPSEAPIHVSNVALVVRQGTKDVVTRVGYERKPSKRKHADGTDHTVVRSVRIAKKTGKEI